MENSSEMKKSMFIDSKEECVMCGCAVGIYLMTPEKGIKICSNISCEWPFSEDTMQVYDFSDIRLEGVNSEGPCSTDKLELIESLSTNIDTSSEFDTESKVERNIITVEKQTLPSPDNMLEHKSVQNEETNSHIFIKPLPMDDINHIRQSLKRVRSRLSTSSDCSSLITQPWMLKRLQFNQALTRRSQKEKEPKFSIQINTQNQSGPAIQIQLLPSDIESTSKVEQSDKNCQPP